ncbi:THAP domain-containing protein 6-like [Rhinichthys klamathensis goyatoka]|uniref:THAP domain-containing protein 6-like n=1 Tax=Rhinichthys klamathensis goyatoka TaxID=3034132 RepID=UPI0024B5A79F|nr:THAP domain-containing protein 6-like [Rhinichthys klamathensis goyatoka]
MPEHCATYSCSNRRTIANRARGITFLKFPKDKDVRKKWEVALRREGFTASFSSVLCSQHFKQGDFDRTGQIVRLRYVVIPSVFSFPVHLQRLEKGRATSTSRRAEESLSVASQDSQETATSHPQPQPNYDHGYALPASPAALKTRLNKAFTRVESLEREKNAMAREKRSKTTVKSILGDLREKNLINEELKEKLEFYSDLQIDLMAKQGHEYTKDYREFALTLHLQGPKAHKYHMVLSWGVLYLSVIGFVINIDTLMLMIPELLQVQRYVPTYRFSQDHLELLFNSIRASGDWNNNPSARQFQAISRRLMVRCGVSSG